MKKLDLCYRVSVEKGPIGKPVSFHFCTDQDKRKSHSAPLSYMTDALLGLSFMELNHYFKSPLYSPKSDYQFTHEAWKKLDPHYEIYQRSQNRIHALRKQLPHLNGQWLEEFQKSFVGAIENAQKPWGVDLKELWVLTDIITFLESKMGNPLLFNMQLHFSKAFTEQLHSLFSFVYNLRTLMAIDYNAHVKDHTHEAIKVDSITDYLPKADYTVNDSLLYWQFKKLSKPFVSGRNSDVRIEKLMVEPMEKSFLHYAHNACYLVKQIPESFLSNMNMHELEEALHLVQMDWLLGSEAGLLFKIREEIFGLQNGYEKIFWHDLDHMPNKNAAHLSVFVQLTEADIYKNSCAA